MLWRWGLFALCAACGGRESTGTVSVTGLGPNDALDTPIATYAYGGSFNNAVPIATVTFYNVTEQSCDGPFDTNGKQVTDVGDLTLVVPSGGLHTGTIPMVQDAESLGASNAAATVTFTTKSSIIIASTSGNVELTDATKTHLAGHFTATMSNGAQITGNFDAPSCSPLW